MKLVDYEIIVSKDTLKPVFRLTVDIEMAVIDEEEIHTRDDLIQIFGIDLLNLLEHITVNLSKMKTWNGDDANEQ